MRKKRKGLQSHFTRIAVIPLILLGIGLSAVSSFFLYSGMTAQVKDGLKNLAYSVNETCDKASSGFYGVNGDGKLTRGGALFDPGSRIVDQVKRISGIDATIFYGDTRVLTTIRDENGNRATGTKAADEVAEKVLKDGGEYFSDHVPVNGVLYFGFYIPMRNGDGSIAGMVFVGKTREVVLATIWDMILWVIAITAAVIVITLAVLLLFTKRIVYSLSKTKEFLGNIANGNLGEEMDEYLLKREDEIGEMGRFSLMLRDSITGLVATDPLTGLYNRRSGEITLHNAAEDFVKNETPYVVAMGDIDWFKEVNDRYGHPTGDEVLKKLSEIFMEHMEKKGFVFRLGGEEFLLLYERMSMKEAVKQLEVLKERIQNAVIDYKGEKVSVTMSFGAAQFKKGCTYEEIVKKADDRLYAAKKAGKNNIQYTSTTKMDMI